MDSHTVEVNIQNFQTEVAEKSRQLPVLLEFYARGAEQCAPTSALLQKLAAEYQGKFTLARVDVEQNPQLVQQLQVRTLPAVKIIFQGQIAGDIEGPADEQQLRGVLNQLTMSPMERVREQVDLLLSRGDRRQAIEMLRQVIAEEPRNFGLHAELGDLLIMEGEVDDARRILEAVPADTEGIDKPKSRLEFIDLAGQLAPLDELRARVQADPADLQAGFDLAIRLIVEDECEAALERLLGIMKADGTWRDELARKTMIRVFTLLGKGNTLATRYRRKMFTHLH